MFRRSRTIPACDSSPADSPDRAGLNPREFADFSDIERNRDAYDPENLLNRVADLAKILTAAGGSAIALSGPQGTTCRARSGDGAPPVGARVDETSSISRQCLQSGRAVYCDDLGGAHPPNGNGNGIRSMVAVPIYGAGPVGGILAVFSGRPSAFNEVHIDKLQRLAKLIDPAAARSIATTGISRSKAPDLKLVLEKEPALQRLFGEATDLVEDSRTQPIAAYDPRGWEHVFVESRIRWKPFFQSIALHVIALSLFFGLARIWPQHRLILLPPLRDARITYYPPSYPARASRRVAAQPKLRRALAAAAAAGAGAGRGSLVVASGVRGKTGGANAGGPAASAPDIRIAGNGIPKVKLGGGSSVAPAPPTNGLQSRLAGLPTATVVAPTPELSGTPGLRRMQSANVAVVPPAPGVGGFATQIAGLRGTQLAAGDPGSASAAIVPPPPAVNEHPALTHGAAGSTFSAGVQVIAPPPSLGGQGGYGRRGKSIGMTGNPDVVPPPPSVAGNEGFGRGTPAGSLSGGAQVVPPSPTIAGNGGLGKRGRAIGLGNGGTAIVPPSPTIAGTGGFGRGDRGAGLGGGGTEVVGPAPSVGTGGGLGGVGSGRGGLLAGTGAVLGPPASGAGSGGNSTGVGAGNAAGTGRGNSVGAGNGTSVAGTGTGAGASGVGAGAGNGGGGNGSGNGAGNSTGGGSGNATGAGNGNAIAGAGTGGGASGGAPDIPAATLSPGRANPPRPVFQEAQLRVVSLAMSLPSTSYFANYEVFVAEKWLSKSESQLIKLVYVFLPYQRRLSEYGDLTKVFKVRVTRDPTCDESLMQIMWPERQNGAGGNGGGQAVAADPADRKNLLPCYRTTADDYRGATSKKRK